MRQIHPYQRLNKPLLLILWRCLSLSLALSLSLSMGLAQATDTGSSSLGAVHVPQPPKPIHATQCVEPTEVMRRDHMKFLLHQRDATVIDGTRNEKHSLVGCIKCHNPASAEKIVRYEDPQHFCAGCHLYASVKIDCFECHADRGLETAQHSQNTLSSATFAARLQLHNNAD